MWLRLCLFLILNIILCNNPTFGQIITADRPGIGADPETVPQYTLQPEMGTDSKEIRLGVLKGFELDRDDTSWGAKVSLVDNDTFKSSLKISYDETLKTVVEIPSNYTYNKWFNLGTDISISKTVKIYAGEFNFTPTSTLTISPTVYFDRKPRVAAFVAWIPPKHQNIQFDIGYDKKKFSIGISTALNFKDIFKK